MRVEEGRRGGGGEGGVKERREGERKTGRGGGKEGGGKEEREERGEAIGSGRR